MATTNWQIAVITSAAACLMVLAGAGCASSAGDQTDDSRPAWWQTNSHRDYPDNRFVIGVGSGTTTEEADASARASLVAYFRSELHAATSRLTSHLVRVGGSDGSLVREESFSESRLLELVTGTLYGSRIAQRDTVADTRYSLAVLERRPFANQLAVDVTNGLVAFDARLVAVAQWLEQDHLLPAALELLRLQEDLAELMVMDRQIRTADAGVAPVRDLDTRTARLAALLGLASPRFTFALLVDCTATDEAGTTRRTDHEAARAEILAALGDTEVPVRVVHAEGLVNLAADAFDQLSAEEQVAVAAPARLLIIARCRSRFSSRFRDLFVYRTDWSATIIDTRTGDTLPAGIAGSGGVSRPHADSTTAALNSLKEVAPQLAEALADALRAGAPR